MSMNRKVTRMVNNKRSYTPEPWEIHDGIIYPVDGVEDGRDWIADLRCAVNEKANSALIASAPDLLAALRDVIDGELFGDEYIKWIHKARAAVARAEGRAL